MGKHPIFGRFDGYAGPRSGGEEVDLIGAKFKGAWWGYHDIAALPHVECGEPPLNEEYFEWVDLLEAADGARDTFTMVELGAGYGRWTVRGGLAALRRGLKPRLLLVEAEPQHAAWAREALAMNGLSGEVRPAAIAYDGEPVPFAVGSPQQDAVNWYGQFRTPVGLGEATDERYFGLPVYRWDVYAQVLVPSETLEQAAGHLGTIDFLDADLQEAEREMVLNSMPFLNERVRRVHIGTHTAEIEDICRRSFGEAGWRPVWDFSLQGERDTPYGRCWFGDGIQAWINPRLGHA